MRHHIRAGGGSLGAEAIKARLFGRPAAQRPAQPGHLEVKRAAPVGLLKAAGDRTYRAIASTGGVDRHGDVIEQDGWDLAAFRSNPIITWNHDYENLPVGRATHIGVERGQLMVEFVLADTRWASQVAALIDQGVLNSASVGFRPIEWQYRDSGLGRRHIRQELLEVAVVSIPANAAALIQAPLAQQRTFRADQPRLARRAADLARLGR